MSDELTLTCPTCHQAVSAEAAFCAQCGASLDVASPTSPRSKRALTAFAVAVVGCVGWIIPVIGVVLGAAALVLGIHSRHSRHKILATIAVVLAIPVIAASIINWAFGAKQYLAQQHNTTTLTTPLSGTQDLRTACYSLELPKALKITRNSDSCTFSAGNAQLGEQYLVKVLKASGVSADTLSEAAQEDSKNIINTTPGSIVDSQGATNFAGSPTYRVILHATDGTAAVVDYVLHDTAQGNVIVILHSQLKPSHTVNLEKLEASWKWL